jgi:hypothetical protein
MQPSYNYIAVDNTNVIVPVLWILIRIRIHFAVLDTALEMQTQTQDPERLLYVVPSLVSF